jgi:hypothetical protein
MELEDNRTKYNNYKTNQQFDVILDSNSIDLNHSAIFEIQTRANTLNTTQANINFAHVELEPIVYSKGKRAGLNELKKPNEIKKTNETNETKKLIKENLIDNTMVDEDTKENTDENTNEITNDINTDSENNKSNEIILNIKDINYSPDDLLNIQPDIKLPPKNTNTSNPTIFDSVENFIYDLFNNKIFIILFIVLIISGLIAYLYVKTPASIIDNN